MTIFERFFEELDALWIPRPSERIRLRVFGSAALMLQANYTRGTKDGDVLETTDLTIEVRRRLIELGGHGTPLHTRHRLYVEVVAASVPFLRQAPRWQKVPAFDGKLQSLDVEVLDVVDVVVSKLKRFNGNDRNDIEAMIDMGLVAHASLVACFEEAIDANSMDARADDFPRYVQNLHVVERDMFGVAASAIVLPSWIESR